MDPSEASRRLGFAIQAGAHLRSGIEMEALAMSSRQGAALGHQWMNALSDGNRDRRRTPVVLVVDDSAASRELIKACLEEVDCQVRLTEDGQGALRSIEESAPDLVLLDVQMPGMDGYEVCRRI